MAFLPHQVLAVALVVVITTGFASAVSASFSSINWGPGQGPYDITVLRSATIEFVNVPAPEIEPAAMTIESSQGILGSTCTGIQMRHVLQPDESITISAAGFGSFMYFTSPEEPNLTLNVTIQEPAQGLGCPAGYHESDHCLPTNFPTGFRKEKDSCATLKDEASCVASSCTWYGEFCAAPCPSTRQACESDPLCTWIGCALDACTNEIPSTWNTASCTTQQGVSYEFSSCDSSVFAPGCFDSNSGVCASANPLSTNFAISTTCTAACSSQRAACNADWQCSHAVYRLAKHLNVVSQGTASGCVEDCLVQFAPKSLDSAKLFWNAVSCIWPCALGVSDPCTCYAEFAQCHDDGGCIEGALSLIDGETGAFENCVASGQSCLNNNRPGDLEGNFLFDQLMKCTIECKAAAGDCQACASAQLEYCSDGIQNQDETEVDCGGVCGSCGTCDNGKQDVGEEDVDCGGKCPKPCPYHIPLFIRDPTPSLPPFSIGDTVVFTGDDEIPYSAVSVESSLCSSLFNSGIMSGNSNFSLRLTSAGLFNVSSLGFALSFVLDVKDVNVCPDYMRPARECQRSRYVDDKVDPCSVFGENEATCTSQSGCSYESAGNICVNDNSFTLCGSLTMGECLETPECAVVCNGPNVCPSLSSFECIEVQTCTPSCQPDPDFCPNLSQAECASSNACVQAENFVCRSACSAQTTISACEANSVCEWHSCVMRNCTEVGNLVIPGCSFPFALNSDGAGPYSGQNEFTQCGSRVYASGCEITGGSGSSECVAAGWRTDARAQTELCSESCRDKILACGDDPECLEVAQTVDAILDGATDPRSACGLDCRQLALLNASALSPTSYQLALDVISCFLGCLDDSCHKDIEDICPNTLARCQASPDCFAVLSCRHTCEQSFLGSQLSTCNANCVSQSTTEGQNLWQDLNDCYEQICQIGGCEHKIRIKNLQLDAVSVPVNMEFFSSTAVDNKVNARGSPITTRHTVKLAVDRFSLTLNTFGYVYEENFGPVRLQTDPASGIWLGTNNIDGSAFKCTADRLETCQSDCTSKISACKNLATCSSAYNRLLQAHDVLQGIHNCDDACVAALAPPTSTTAYQRFVDVTACLLECVHSESTCNQFQCLEESIACSADQTCSNHRDSLCLSCEDPTENIDISPNAALQNLGQCERVKLTCPDAIVISGPDEGSTTADVKLTFSASHVYGFRELFAGFGGIDEEMPQFSGSGDGEPTSVTVRPQDCSDPATIDFTGRYDAGTTQEVRFEVQTWSQVYTSCSTSVTVEQSENLETLRNVYNTLQQSQPTTAQDAEDSTRQLREIAENTNNLGGSEITVLADSAEILVQNGGFIKSEADLQSNATKNMFRTFAGAVGAASDKAKASQNANKGMSRLRKAQEEFNKQINNAVKIPAGKNQTEIEFSSDKTRLRVVKVTKSAFEKQQIDDTKTGTKFVLPDAVKGACSNVPDDGEIGIIFQVYETNNYFTSSSQGINPTVVSCSLPDCTLPDEVDPPFEFEIPASSGLCAFWNETTEQWSQTGVATGTIKDGKIICTTTHLTNFAVLLGAESSGAHAEALSNITIVFSSLSLVALLLTILTHSGFRRLRALVPSKVLLGLACSLFVSLVVFIIASEAADSVDGDTCTALAILLHYFWLTAACWMLVQGANLYAVTVIVLGLDMEKRLIFYNVFAWGVPGVIVAITAGVAGKGDYGDDSFCWINNKTTLIAGFIAPLGVMLLCNFWFFLRVVRAIRESAEKARRRSSSSSSDEQRLIKDKKREARASISLIFLLGLGWIFGAFIDTGDTSSSLVFQYLFSIFATCQGIALFIFYCVLNPRVIEEYRRSTGSSRGSTLSNSKTGTAGKKKKTDTNKSNTTDSAVVWPSSNGFTASSVGESTTAESGVDSSLISFEAPLFHGNAGAADTIEKTATLGSYLDAVETTYDVADQDESGRRTSTSAAAEEMPLYDEADQQELKAISTRLDLA